MSDSVWLHRRQPTRLPRPWDSPGKNTGVGCHFLFQCMKVKSESEGSINLGLTACSLSNPILEEHMGWRTLLLQHLFKILHSNEHEWLPSSSNGKESACNAGDQGSTPGLGSSSGERNGNPLQYSCLENSMDREAWQATVHGVAKSWTRLSD